MSLVSLAPVLTPHGRLVVERDEDAPALDAELAQRMERAFTRGSGHGLLALGGDEIGVALPPTFSLWREFGALYVTGVCTRPIDAAGPYRAHPPTPPKSELDQFVLGAPPMAGADYLSAAVLSDLWQELDRAFWADLTEAKCSIEEFLKRRNPADHAMSRRMPSRPGPLFRIRQRLRAADAWSFQTLLPSTMTSSSYLKSHDPLC
jgi:hypothetical protein